MERNEDQLCAADDDLLPEEREWTENTPPWGISLRTNAEAVAEGLKRSPQAVHWLIGGLVTALAVVVLANALLYYVSLSTQLATERQQRVSDVAALRQRLADESARARAEIQTLEEEIARWQSLVNYDLATLELSVRSGDPPAGPMLAPSRPPTVTKER